MGVMGSPTRMVAASLVMVLVLVSSTVTAFDGYDGVPRPSGMDDEPTTTLGARPAVEYEGKAADCIWYAWENFHYPPEETSNCSNLLWSSLSQDADPATLEGFTYYAPIAQPEFYDPTYQEYFCLIGCFDLAASGGPSPAPETSPPTANPPVNAPPPGDTQPPAMPPPAGAPASPAVPPPSPPVMAPPPPATLFRPPPSGLPLPPPSIVTPPTGTSGTQAPGPATQTSAGRVLRLNSGSSLFVFVGSSILVHWVNPLIVFVQF